MKVLRVLSVSPTFHKLDLGGAEASWSLTPFPFSHTVSRAPLPPSRASRAPARGSLSPAPAHPPRALTLWPAAG